MVARNEYPRLRDFIAGVFHPDWSESHRSCLGAIDAAIASECACALQRIASDAAALAASRATDEQITRWLGLIGCYVALDREGLTSRGLLTLIGDRITSAPRMPL